jgi:hypothetical protein
MKQNTHGLEPFSIEEEQRIIGGCVKAARNIDSLTDKAYSFLNLSSGFIAHYNKSGFMDYYREPGSLKKDILNNQRNNQWGTSGLGSGGMSIICRKRIYITPSATALKTTSNTVPGGMSKKLWRQDFGR